MLFMRMLVVSLTSRFANIQFANVLRRSANVFSRFANFEKLLISVLNLLFIKSV